MRLSLCLLYCQPQGIPVETVRGSTALMGLPRLGCRPPMHTTHGLPCPRSLNQIPWLGRNGLQIAVCIWVSYVTSVCPGSSIAVMAGEVGGGGGRGEVEGGGGR